jgi:hypothetical protein
MRPAGNTVFARTLFVRLPDNLRYKPDWAGVIELTLPKKNFASTVYESCYVSLHVTPEMRRITSELHRVAETSAAFGPNHIL